MNGPVIVHPAASLLHTFIWEPGTMASAASARSVNASVKFPTKYLIIK